MSNLIGMFMDLCYCFLHSSVCLKYWRTETKETNGKAGWRHEGGPWVSEGETGLYFLGSGEPSKVLE